MRTGLIKGLSIAQSLAQPSSTGWRRGGSAVNDAKRLSNQRMTRRGPIRVRGAADMASVAHGLNRQAEQQVEINRLKSLGKQHPLIQMDFESILERGK